MASGMSLTGANVTLISSPVNIGLLSLLEILNPPICMSDVKFGYVLSLKLYIFRFIPYVSLILFTIAVLTFLELQISGSAKRNKKYMTAKMVSNTALIDKKTLPVLIFMFL